MAEIKKSEKTKVNDNPRYEDTCIGGSYGSSSSFFGDSSSEISRGTITNNPVEGRWNEEIVVEGTGQDKGCLVSKYRVSD